MKTVNKRKTAITAGTVTADKECEKAEKEFPRKNYSTFKGKLQEEIAKFLCISSFGFMYGVMMYAICYICGAVR